MRIVLTTFPSPRSAARVVRSLVDRRLAACGTLVPVASVYRWKGKVGRARETLVLLKTTRRRVDALRGALAELHPYEVPEIVVLAPSGVAPPYLAWLRASVREPRVKGSRRSRAARAPR